MALNWKILRSEHVAQAAAIVRTQLAGGKASRHGIFVIVGSDLLPAKKVVREAYCIAANLPRSSHLKFASGESTIKLLQTLGFEAGRQPSTGKLGPTR